MESSTSHFIGSIPELYDRHLGPVIFEPYAADLSARVAQLEPRDVLEIACGTGIATRRIREALPSRTRVTATDLNSDMLGVARRRIPDADVSWRVADGTDLPFEDGSFDVVACQFGVMFFPDRAAGMREARRVLRAEGRYVFSVWDVFAHNPFGRIVHETIASFFPEDPPAFYLTPFGFTDEAQIRELLRGAGFASIEIERAPKEALSRSARDFATGLVGGNPVSLTILERGTVSLEQVEAVVAAALAREGGDRPFRSSMQALVVAAGV